MLAAFCLLMKLLKFPTHTHTRFPVHAHAHRLTLPDRLTRPCQKHALLLQLFNKNYGYAAWSLPYDAEMATTCAGVAECSVDSVAIF